MSTVLIVDDSPVDRRLVGGLLAKQDDLCLQFATNGVEALAAIREEVPDIVVTDMIMPEMDGLELVKAIHQQYPLVPVILMTSKGNEQIAVQALQAGAASYTPKSALAAGLVETIRSLLELFKQKQSHIRLLECVTESVLTFQLDNDYTLIPALVNYLQENAARIGACNDADRVRVGVALDEALVNALYHGNLELSSKLRDTDQEQYVQLVHERRRTPPYCERKIIVQVRLSAEEASFVIRDEGPGFDSAMLPDPRDPANLEDLGGRGVLLMRTFMDEVCFNATGNEVTMIKRKRFDGNKSNENGDS